MNKAERALNELNEMDELADVSSPVHRLPALSKLLTTLIFIIIPMSYGRHDLTVIWMAVYPYIVFQLSRIPFRTCLRKIRFLLPFVIFAGIFNPLFDTEILINLGKIYLSGGQVSFIVLVIKGVLALSGAFLLAATARIDAVCAALRRLHVPPIFTTLILLTYRYVSVMTEEVAVMTDAYHLRAPHQKGIHISAWGSFFGQLLLRTMDRAKALYASMELRGYAGEFPSSGNERMTVKGVLWVLCWTVFFLIFRTMDVAALIVNPFAG